MIPLYFVEKGKTNYALKRYAGLDYNFFPIVDGKPDCENEKFKDVLNTFVKWSLNN